MTQSNDHIDAMLRETRVIHPSADFQARARVSREEYERRYRQSLDDPDTFWAEVAGELHWMEPWTQVLDWQEPHAQWFVGAKTNVAYNALDRQVQRGLGDKRAIIWEGEDGQVRCYKHNVVSPPRTATTAANEGRFVIRLFAKAHSSLC